MKLYDIRVSLVIVGLVSRAFQGRKNKHFNKEYQI